MLLTLAIALLVLSGLLLFVWPVVWTVPGQRMAAITSQEARFLAGSVGTVALVVVSAPMLAVLSQPGAGAVLAAFEATMTMVFDI
ncbi:MAG: hypothetical protein AAF829_02940 [Pseudomonadota bacterium]